MKQQRFDTVGGLTAPVQVYERSDIDANPALIDGLLSKGNKQMVYHEVLGIVREIVSDLVEEETGIERQSKVVGKTKGGKDILQYEADGKYLNRVMSSKGWDDLSAYQSRVDDACLNFKEEGSDTSAPLACDVAERERKAPKSIKLAAKYKVAAARVIAIGNIEAVNANQLAKINKGFTATGDMSVPYTGTYVDADNKEVAFTVSDKDAEALGRLIKEYRDWKDVQELKAGGI